MMLRMMQGICPMDIFPCLRTVLVIWHSLFFHSNIDRAAAKVTELVKKYMKNINRMKYE